MTMDDARRRSWDIDRSSGRTRHVHTADDTVYAFVMHDRSTIELIKPSQPQPAGT